MLILPRENRQSLIIGDGIIVTVLEIHGKRVRLGIEVPDGGSCYRGEVVTKNKEKMAAKNFDGSWLPHHRCCLPNPEGQQSDDQAS